MCLFFLINSDVLYPKDTSSPHSGVPAEVLCRGRDFVVSITYSLKENTGEVCLRCHGIAKLLLYCNKVFLPKKSFML